MLGLWVRKERNGKKIMMQTIGIYISIFNKQQLLTLLYS